MGIGWGRREIDNLSLYSLVFRGTIPEELHKKSCIHTGSDLNDELLDLKLMPYWAETWNLREGDQCILHEGRK